MRFGGIDVGSRYVKYVILENGNSLFLKRETGHDPLSICLALINHEKSDKLIATGYGRHLLEIHQNMKTITEIKAVARGAIEIFPSCRTIIDIGGQDTKVIRLNQKGLVGNFEMNDRCAAGTGKFIEVMAKALGYHIEDFGNQCNKMSETIKINSMCTVFAESEVISLITKGIKRESIAYALLQSVTNRVTALTKRIGINEDIVFAGGCAKNDCLKGMIAARLNSELYIHEHPDMLSALGAALYTAD